MLPMDELLKPDGYIGKLKAQGYVVETPEDGDDIDPATSSSVGVTRDADSTLH